MSTRRGAVSKGPPKHQNRSAWKANSGVKKNDRELGGKLHPYPAITGVCPRCRAQIEWRRKYGKYKALNEPAKCNQCGKRAVRQAHHALCPGCAKERNVCAKCCRPSETIIGRDSEIKEEERRQLEQALKNLRERDKRSLLRAMSQGTTKANIKETSSKTKKIGDEDDGDTEGDSELEEDEDFGASCCSEGESDASYDSIEDTPCKEERPSARPEAYATEFPLQKLSLSKDTS